MCELHWGVPVPAPLHRSRKLPRDLEHTRNSGVNCTHPCTRAHMRTQALARTHTRAHAPPTYILERTIAPIRVHTYRWVNSVEASQCASDRLLTWTGAKAWRTSPRWSGKLSGGGSFDIIFLPFIFLSHGVLFCSKWYELMPGTPWPDLEEKIRAGTVLGEWPTARDHWGRHAQMSLPAFHTRWH